MRSYTYYKLIVPGRPPASWARGSSLGSSSPAIPLESRLVRSAERPRLSRVTSGPPSQPRPQSERPSMPRAHEESRTRRGPTACFPPSCAGSQDGTVEGHPVRHRCRRRESRCWGRRPPAGRRVWPGPRRWHQRRTSSFSFCLFPSSRRTKRAKDVRVGRVGSGRCLVACSEARAGSPHGAGAHSARRTHLGCPAQA